MGSTSKIGKVAKSEIFIAKYRYQAKKCKKILPHIASNY